MTDFDSAVRAQWAGRDLQTQKQIDSGKIDAGTRGAVTGGRHLDPLQEAVAGLFSDPTLGSDLVVRATGKLTLPGHYRRSKNWDIIVMYRDILVAAVEFKSQVGSVGNNANNRSEEVIGNAVDTWKSYEEGLLGSVRPWLGYVMLIEECHETTKPVGMASKPLYDLDPIFATNSSFTDRYKVALHRMVRERIYDAAVLATTEKGQGVFREPDPLLSFQNFEDEIAGRMAFIRAKAARKP
ncbi:PaeR7I family type II restriction endonuclease [Gordonia sp. (in: high G+C Gram-positive bacteria)]|uniref:PaeR7I family type II restriction endonuclease n=1 Tax=Gordonia sp. (in: high G+C Gram-positive bacteria) TaxID=84139 RepID=UPI0039E31DF9